MARDGFGLLEMVMDRWKWQWIDGDGYGQLEMAMDGQRQLWMAMDSWIWILMVGCSFGQPIEIERYVYSYLFIEIGEIGLDG